MPNKKTPFQTRESIHYSFIPNHRETMLALARARFNNQEYRAIIALMNQTDGYLRDEDDISISFWQSITLMSTESLLHTIKRLIARGVISEETKDKKRFYRLNHPNQWPPETFAPQMVTTKALREAQHLLQNEKQPDHFLWLKRIIESAKALAILTPKSNPSGITADSNTVQPDSKSLEKPPESSIASSSKLPPTDSNADLEVDATETEKKALRELRDIKNWPFDFKKDLDYLRKLLIDFPTVDVLHEISRFAAYQLDHPLKKSSSPRLRLRHWMEHTSEFVQRGGHYAGKRLSKSGRDTGPRRTPTNEQREASLNQSLQRE